MRSILWGAPYGGINTFPKSLVDLNYANFNAISHCEIHRGHQENQRYSFSSQNLQSSAGKIRNPGSSVQPLSCRKDIGQIPETEGQALVRVSSKLQG